MEEQNIIEIPKKPVNIYDLATVGIKDRFVNSISLDGAYPFEHKITTKVFSTILFRGFIQENKPREDIEILGRKIQQDLREVLLIGDPYKRKTCRLHVFNKKTIEGLLSIGDLNLDSRIPGIRCDYTLFYLGDENPIAIETYLYPMQRIVP